MRGIIPGHILACMNRILSDAGDERPLYSHFDLIAGTSTGALLALALACPVEKSGLEAEKKGSYEVKDTARRGIFRRPVISSCGFIAPGADPEKLEDLYRVHGPQIFPKNIYSKSLLYPIFSEKYDVLPYESFLRNSFRDIKLSEMRVPVMVVCYAPADGKKYIASSWQSHGFTASEAARASSAAPMYFPPAVLTEKDTGKERILVDGGLVANNPALLAYAGARKLYPEADEFRMLSLSTCSAACKFDPRDGFGGITSWASPITKLYADASLQVADETASAIKDLVYTRIWAPVLEKKVKLDSTKEETIAVLEKAATDMYRVNESRIKAYMYDLAASGVHESVRLKDRSKALLPSQG